MVTVQKRNKSIFEPLYCCMNNAQLEHDGSLEPQPKPFIDPFEVLSNPVSPDKSDYDSKSFLTA